MLDLLGGAADRGGGRILSEEEACEYLGCDGERLTALRERHGLPMERGTDGRWQIRPDALAQWGAEEIHEGRLSLD